MQAEIVDRYKVILKRDARYDGKFYFAVKTTGIFCLPSCPAPRPLEKNVLFYVTISEAMNDGFRACRRCHPTQSPVDHKAQILKVISTENETTVQSLALNLNVSDRHLRRIVTKKFGFSPLHIIQAKRIAIAKDLLIRTRLHIIDIAFLAGFESLRQFNDIFKRDVELTPRAFRKSHTTTVPYISTSDNKEEL